MIRPSVYAGRADADRRAAYEHLLGFGVPMVTGTRHLYVAGDIARLVADCSIRGTARQGYRST
ncbi:hypothetical protein J2S43_003593 [Catenuloplanes nepalensis]|uniref:Uncharacterized protein n=1 Tax=Catenuloplanes nepalensis TaxID=587533 RepID=A0ABT9MVP7_9ACTN|nr:hypothetical protein [Catenuloplanes nepalensis]MDP9795081.1 hypothetical protein [Catenuloplanes nepalensis]